MTSPYPPLRLVENRHACPSLLRRFFRLGRTPRAEHLVQQMAARPAFPDAAWGGEVLRREVAQAVSEIVREEIGWPNGHFQPADPMDKVLFNVNCDGDFVDNLEVETAVIRIERLLEVALSQEEETALLEGTLGEAVDALIGKSPDAAFCLRRNTPGAPEAGPCPSLAAFLDLREYLVKVQNLAPKGLHPSTPLRGLAQGWRMHQLDEYVFQRFQVSNCVSPHRPWRRALKGGALIAAFLLAVGYPCYGNWAMGAAAVAMVGAAWTAARRVPEARRMAKYRVRTLGDLVRCICAERMRRAAAGAQE